MRRLRFTTRTAGIATGLYVAIWAAVSFIFDIELLNTAGWAVFYLIGLGWTLAYVERAASRLERAHPAANEATRFHSLLGLEATQSRKNWNPFDPSSRCYNFRTLGLLFLGKSVVAIAGWTIVLLAIKSGVVQYLKDKPDVIASAPTWFYWVRFGALAYSAMALLWLSAIFSQSRRLRQSLGSIMAYTVVFIVVYFVAHIRFGAGGDEWADDLPAGGGTDSPQAMSVKVQKIIRKRYVVNPYSSILFAAPPPIDNVQVNLEAETANRYQVGQGDGGFGQGDGEGGGFGSGTAKGKMNFYRLRHADRGWDKNFGVGGDYNLLLEFVIRYPKMKGRIAEESTSIDCAQLGRASEKAPPYMVYIGGQSFAPTAQDKKALKQYVIDRHGMIIGDCLGPGFPSGFSAAMTEITGVQPVPIPRDDPIHKYPFALPQLPIVVAHGGSTPYGWRVDGRWAVYLHPGALSDAWRDDRAGIRKEIAAQCFELGLNFMAYATKEQDKWRRSQKQ